MKAIKALENLSKELDFEVTTTYVLGTDDKWMLFKMGEFVLKSKDNSDPESQAIDILCQLATIGISQLKER